MIDLQELREHETVAVALSDRQARRLETEASPYLTVASHRDFGMKWVTTREYVGSLVVDDMRILIRPKVSLENLFLLLEVGLPEQAWRREDFDYAFNHDLVSSLVSFYARTVETTLARGLYRSYREQQQDLNTVRGRIDFGKQLSRARLPLPVACRYGEFTADVTENRGLRAAVRLALRVPGVPGADRRRLMRELVAMEEVSDAPISGDDLRRVHYTRLNQHYRPAVGLARLLLDNLTLVDRRGSTTAASFMVNMNNIFETFVTKRLRRALQDRLVVRNQASDYLDTGREISIRPDLRFRHPGSDRDAYVADIKYKLTTDAQGRATDYYQLLAYTTALKLPEGVLIYCRTDGDKPAGEITVRHAGKKLHVHAVDMTGSPTQVTRELKQLADWIAARSEQARVPHQRKTPTPVGVTRHTDLGA